MKDVFDQMRERLAGNCAVLGQAIGSGRPEDLPPQVLAAARQVHDALAGLPLETARNVLHLVHSALDVSAVVQDRRDVGAAGLTATEMEKRQPRTALEAARMRGEVSS